MQKSQISCEHVDYDKPTKYKYMQSNALRAVLQFKKKKK